MREPYTESEMQEMRDKVSGLEQENGRLKSDIQQMVEKATQNDLSGYRELGQKCAELEVKNDTLRGQLENCINYLERAKRRCVGHDFDAAIESANKALYETQAQAKLDAEVLRAAYAYANFEIELQHIGTGSPDASHARDLIEAVQAAKE